MPGYREIITTNENSKFNINFCEKESNRMCYIALLMSILSYKIQFLARHNINLPHKIAGL